MWWQLPKMLQKHDIQPTLFITHDLGTYFATLRARKIYGVPSILFLSHIPTTLAGTRSFSLLRVLYQKLLNKLLYKKIDYLYAISDAVSTYTCKYLGAAEGDIGFFAPQTIPVDVQEKLKQGKGVVRRRYGIAQDKHLLLSVGRFEPEKGHDSLLRAFAALHDDSCVLLLVGSGSLEAPLREQVRKHNLQNSVIFAGDVPHEHIWEYYSDSDVFIAQSQSEALGLVAWEAMIASIPVITSRVEGFIESVGDKEERGFFWQEGDDINMLRKIINDCICKTDDVKIKASKAKESVTMMLHKKVDIDMVLFNLKNKYEKSAEIIYRSRNLRKDKNVIPAKGDDALFERERGELFYSWIGEGKQVLDLGCRYGSLTSYFTKGNTILGIDIDDASLKMCPRGIKTEQHDLHDD